MAETPQPQEDPVDLARRARRQTKAAAKNASKAARIAAEPAIEEARETVEKLEETAEDALETARRVNPKMMGRISEDVGWAFLALSVSIYTGTLSVRKFREAYGKRAQIMRG